MKEVHDRTPVIVSKQEEDEYLDGELSREHLEDKVVSNIEIEQVSTDVNDPDNDNPEILERNSRQTRLN